MGDLNAQNAVGGLHESDVQVGTMLKVKDVSLLVNCQTLGDGDEVVVKTRDGFQFTVGLPDTMVIKNHQVPCDISQLEAFELAG